MITALLFTLAVSAGEPVLIDIITAKPTTNRPPIISREIKLEDVSSQGERLTPERLKELERARSGGGDDVGNGGDELRREFIESAQRVVEEIGDKTLRDQLKTVLSIRRVVVVNGLQLNHGGERTASKAHVVEGLIFLDEQTWNPSSGVLSVKVDARFAILKLLAEAAGLEMQKEELLTIWNDLSALQGQKIWCHANVSARTSSQVTQDFRTSHPSSLEVARAAGFEMCANAGFADCRVTEAVQRGFGGASRFNVTVRGMREELRWRSEAELKAARCQAVRQCEESYDWAPRGQVRFSDYRELETVAGRECNT